MSWGLCGWGFCTGRPCQIHGCMGFAGPMAIPWAVSTGSSSTLHLRQTKGSFGGKRGGGVGGRREAAYIRLKGAKVVEAGISLAVGLGSSTLHPSHKVSQALQPCCCCIICHMQPCLQSQLGLTSHELTNSPSGFRVMSERVTSYRCSSAFVSASRADDLQSAVLYIHTCLQQGG